MAETFGSAAERGVTDATLLLAETEKFYLEEFKSAYVELPADWQTLRHIGAHVAKAGLKLVEYRTGSRPVYDIVEQVIPDLAIYRSMIINLSREELELPGELVGGGCEDDALASILAAQGLIASVIEPAEHGPRSVAAGLPPGELEKIAGKLHAAATVLAETHDIDLTEAQRIRMDGLLTDL
ncbi:hypothetical protein F4X86_00100 [Candidatus Saccharibacteria bacterium]|nr:hypothetical protein [Candidatus Saccharibacteria bacterium]